ncbi:condensation domain-containing protein, partial [Rossellomorea aquimaris]
MKIDKSNIEDIVALSSTQEGILYHHLKDVRSNKYFEQFSLTLNGKLDKELFEEAWNYVVKNNEALRTVFRWKKLKQPIQVILKEKEIKKEYYDLSNTQNQTNELENIKEENRLTNKIDLTENPFKVTLCKLNDVKYEMIIDNHHIILDGWSNGILLAEFSKAYDYIANDKIPEFPLKLKTKEYIKWINNQKDKSTSYWENYLKEYKSQEINYGSKDENDLNQSNKVSSFWTLDEVQSLKNIASKLNITLANFINTAWGILLQKLTNNQDVIFGTTVSGRNVPLLNIENSVGLFINTLPMRFNFSGDERLIDCLRKVQDSSLERQEFENISLLDIKKVFNLNASEELLESIVVYENYPIDKYLKDNSTFSINKIDSKALTNYNLTLVVHENPFNIEILFNKQKYCHKDIESILNFLKTIMLYMVDNVEKNINEVNLVNDYEREILLDLTNKRSVNFPKDKMIHTLFEQQVKKKPDNIAVVLNDEWLTYDELNRKSNQLARTLREHGVKKGELVGVMTDRSLEMIISMLAVLKAGGAYVPI